MSNSDYFERELGYINNSVLREITARTLDNAPECFIHIPASSSGKYHPAYSLGEGGLMRHVQAAVGMAHTLIEIDIFKNLIFGTEADPSQGEINLYADCAYAALILHDCMKPSDDENHTTRFDHPLLGATLFVDTYTTYLQDHDVSIEDIRFLRNAVPLIKKAIESHMGQFTTSQYMPDVTLPKPKSALEMFVHQMDYLASRKYLIFDFNVYEEVDR